MYDEKELGKIWYATFRKTRVDNAVQMVTDLIDDIV